MGIILNTLVQQGRPQQLFYGPESLVSAVLHSGCSMVNKSTLQHRFVGGDGVFGGGHGRRDVDTWRPVTGAVGVRRCGRWRAAVDQVV